MTSITVCVDCANLLGENPLWDVAEQQLYWIDGMSREIWRCAADGSQVRTWHLPEQTGAIGCMALRAGGGAVLGCETGIYLFDFASQRLERVADPVGGEAQLRLNDGKVDSQGRLIVGSVDFEAMFPAEGTTPAARGALYRLDADHRVTRIADDIIVSNGPCWSPDQRTFYLADSWRDVIHAFAWDEQAGEPGPRRPFATLPPRSIPDGGTVDAEGHVWTTVNGAYSGEGALIRLTPDGSVERKIVLPLAKATSLAFGGPDLDVIYVTSNRIDTDPADTRDGRLLAIRGLGIRGLPERRFRG